MTTTSQPEQTSVQIDDYTGAMVNVEDKIQTAALSIVHDTDNAISLSDDSENHTIGLKDPGNCDMDGVYTRAWAQLAIYAWRAPAQKTYSVNLMPNGSTTGLETNAFETIMTGFEMSVDDSSTAQFNRKNKITGVITKGVNP